MRNIRRYVAATIVATVMTLSAVTPANAVYDSRGNLVAVIITSDGEVYY
jgi:hypothetical protein